MTRSARLASVGAALAFAGLAAIAASAGPDAAVLRFERNGEVVQQVSLTGLQAACPTERVVVERDPYYERRKSFLALSLRCVLEYGFGEPLAARAEANFFLRARDGYAVPASGARLAEPGGHLAFSDAERATGQGSGWEPIGRRELDPGPFYVVWTGPDQADPHQYPWPFQLASVDLAAFETEYPHTIPNGAPADSPAWRGYALFRSECIACHAVNREGGKVGPDLNVPRSIVEYRPAAQIKAFIRDPQSFRYTTMPPHPHLGEEQLDALLAYFEAMSRRKADPEAGGAYPRERNE